MGVKGLWQLLAPSGRRVTLESLAGSTLAVDASIWSYFGSQTMFPALTLFLRLIQFIKAMREADGSIKKNAHLIGFFRRILKLLFHGIKPVLVFDGATPEIKKRTTASRRKRREKTEDQFRKTAEKLLLNQVKLFSYFQT